MYFAGIILLTVVPGLLWLWIFYRLDKYEPEPLSLIFKVMILGAVVTLPSSLLENILGDLIPSFEQLLHNEKISAGFISSFLIIGPVEEFFKFAVVRYYAYRSREFNEPMDGIIYASACAIGFAIVENIIYLDMYGIELFRQRSIFSMPAHILFASMWGYALGMGKFNKNAYRKIVIRGLVYAMLAHGLYDFLLFAGSWVSLFALLLLPVLWKIMVKNVGISLRVSPFRFNLYECSHCGMPNMAKKETCGWCHKPLIIKEKPAKNDTAE